MKAVLIALLVVYPVKAEDKTLTDKQIYHMGLDALVGVTVMYSDQVSGNGSGVIVATPDNKQLVITSYHITKRSDEQKREFMINIFAIWDSPAKLDYNAWAVAEILNSDEESDLILLKLNKRLPRATVELASVDVAQTDDIYFFGHAAEAPTTFGKGVVTRTYYPAKKNKPWCQYTGFAWPGMSGGPILNTHGQLVGIIEAFNSANDPFSDGRVGIPNIGYFCNTSKIRALIKTYVRK